MPASPKPRVLVVDDEKALCSMLEVFFEKRGYEVRLAHRAQDALPALQGQTPDLAMVDLSLGEDSGLTVVTDLLRRFPDLPVVVMTAYGTVEKAVEAIKLGAFDFIAKPFEMVFLAKVVEKAASTYALKRENTELKSLIKRQSEVELIGSSEVMRRLKEKVAAIALSDVTVLVTGESGTGKELVAKLIHQKSRRAGGPFVVVNCSALSENLLESELFGHVKGAFTSAYADKEGLFAVASGGTLFLDEIGEMPLRTQVKLLRVLQEREITPVGGTVSMKIDVRILAATNVNMEEAVQRGSFREDLYYRLNVLRLYTPRLSEREGDALLIANFFLEKKTRGQKAWGEKALQQIVSYSWPGNVRQLENAVERAIAFSPGPVISEVELDARVFAGEAARSDARGFEGRGPEGRWSEGRDDRRAENGGEGRGEGRRDGLEGARDSTFLPLEGGERKEEDPLFGGIPSLAEVEKAYIHWILSQNNWHKPTAARILGLDISTLYRKIERFGFKAPA